MFMSKSHLASNILGCTLQWCFSLCSSWQYGMCLLVDAYTCLICINSDQRNKIPSQNLPKVLQYISLHEKGSIRRFHQGWFVFLSHRYTVWFSHAFTFSFSLAGKDFWLLNCMKHRSIVVI
jgi:hypothetical protein